MKYFGHKIFAIYQFHDVHVPVMMSLLLVQTPDRRSIAAQPWQRAVHMIRWPSRRSPWEMPRPLASGTCAQRKTEHTAATQVQLKEWTKRLCEIVKTDTQ